MSIKKVGFNSPWGRTMEEYTVFCFVQFSNGDGDYDTIEYEAVGETPSAAAKALYLELGARHDVLDFNLGDMYTINGTPVSYKLDY